jgi:hypothetical protein
MELYSLAMLFGGVERNPWVRERREVMGGRDVERGVSSAIDKFRRGAELVGYSSRCMGVRVVYLSAESTTSSSASISTAGYSTASLLAGVDNREVPFRGSVEALVFSCRRELLLLLVFVFAFLIPVVIFDNGAVVTKVRASYFTGADLISLL